MSGLKVLESSENWSVESYNAGEENLTTGDGFVIGPGSLVTKVEATEDFVKTLYYNTWRVKWSYTGLVILKKDGEEVDRVTLPKT